MSSASALASRPAAAAPLRASVARRARRAATSTRAVAVDPDAANNAVAAPSSEPSSGDAAASLKKRIVALAAASGRGLDATAAQKAAAASLIADLIAVNPTSDPAMSAKVNGDWELQSVKRSREKTFLASFFFFLQASSRRFVSSFRTFSRAVITAP